MVEKVSKSEPRVDEVAEIPVDTTGHLIETVEVSGEDGFDKNDVEGLETQDLIISISAVEGTQGEEATIANSGLYMELFEHSPTDDTPNSI